MAEQMTEFRLSVAGIVQAEFAGDGVNVRADKLHDSLGFDGPVAAAYPERQQTGEDGISEHMLVMVQLFRRYSLEIDPQQRVDPALIESWVGRLQRALAAADDPEQEGIWYYNVAGVEYPDDPTGNKSRALIAIEGFGNGPRMFETAG